MKCSRCGKEITEFKIEVSLGIHTERMKDRGAWEEVAPMKTHSREILCIDCFNTFAEVLSQMNIPYQPPTN